MIKYPFINMPDYYVYLLRENMQATGELFQSLPVYVKNNVSFQSLFERCFHKVDKQLRVDYVLKALGWHGLRDRFASIYLYYNDYGKFPFEGDSSLVTEITQFEKKIAPFTVQGYSRAYLFAFYMKLAKRKIGPFKEQSLDIPDDVIEILRIAKLKVVKIDWMLAILTQFYFFLGKDLKLHIKAGKRYGFLFNLLEQEQKEQFIKNLLAYGCSIGEHETFYGKTV